MERFARAFDTPDMSRLEGPLFDWLRSIHMLVDERKKSLARELPIPEHSSLDAGGTRCPWTTSSASTKSSRSRLSLRPTSWPPNDVLPTAQASHSGEPLAQGREIDHVGSRREHVIPPRSGGPVGSYFGEACHDWDSRCGLRSDPTQTDPEHGHGPHVARAAGLRGGGCDGT